MAGELAELCSSARDFVSAAKTQEGILTTYATPSELAASTMAYAVVKERYYSVLRSKMPILIAIGLKRIPATAEIREFRSVFDQFGEEQEEQVAKATVEMLKRSENDEAIGAAEKEFKQAQEMEASFTRILTALILPEVAGVTFPGGVLDVAVTPCVRMDWIISFHGGPQIGSIESATIHQKPIP